MKGRKTPATVVAISLLTFCFMFPLKSDAEDLGATQSDSWSTLGGILDGNSDFLGEGSLRTAARKAPVNCEIKSRRTKSGKSQKYCPVKANCLTKRPYCVSKMVRTRSGKKKPSCGCSAKAPGTNTNNGTNVPTPTPPPSASKVCDNDLPVPQFPLVADPKIDKPMGPFPIRKVCGAWYFYEISEQVAAIGGYDISFQFFTDGSYRIDYLHQAVLNKTCFGGSEWKAYEKGNFIFFPEGALVLFPTYWHVDASVCGIEFTKEKSPTSADIRNCPAGEVTIGSLNKDSDRIATGGLGLICDVAPWQAPYARRWEDYAESTSVFALQRIE